jgi:hypothetical protein
MVISETLLYLIQTVYESEYFIYKKNPQILIENLLTVIYLIYQEATCHFRYKLSNLNWVPYWRSRSIDKTNEMIKNYGKTN